MGSGVKNLPKNEELIISFLAVGTDVGSREAKVALEQVEDNLHAYVYSTYYLFFRLFIYSIRSTLLDYYCFYFIFCYYPDSSIGLRNLQLPRRELVFLIFSKISHNANIFCLYHKTSDRRLRHRVTESERQLRKQNEYFTSQLHTEMQKQITYGEKHAEEMKKQQDMMQAQFDRQLDMAYQQGSKIQILPPFNQNPHFHDHSEHTGKESF